MWFAIVDYDNTERRAFAFSTPERAVKELVEGWNYDNFILTNQEPELAIEVLRSTTFLECTREELYWQHDRAQRERAVQRSNSLP